MLNPKDEYPMIRMGDYAMSQFQHGNIYVGSGLSVGLVFRCVTDINTYSVKSNKKAMCHTDNSYLQGKSHIYK